MPVVRESSLADAMTTLRYRSLRDGTIYDLHVRLYWLRAPPSAERRRPARAPTTGGVCGGRALFEGATAGTAAFLTVQRFPTLGRRHEPQIIP